VKKIIVIGGGFGGLTAAAELAKRIEHIETAREPDFEQIFTNQMGF
jgi:2-polyprenyl-6-methoxyphenol hydroxylase-like FAD-dependent oxidoreductase